ncbi:methionine ABC transporter ATP-binding protein [Helicobacter typhlonius]|uniref:methionine ABC transporter ATP-binding protein n=1 Tax=Helicobacter typhlonius TaxID=76936 RepID=UPI002FE0EE32
MDLIKVQNLSKSYGNLEVLKNINLRIKKGSIFGLVGHSGAGKSTLLRTFNGLESINSGKIEIDNLDISKLTTKELRAFRQKVGMIFQHFSLLSRKNVYENILLPLQCAKATINEAKIKNLLELVGLQDKAKSYPNELSGGQKQRVAIARAIVRKPAILLLDEPTSALDKSSQKLILSLLLELQAQLNMSYIFITHDLEILRALSDEVLILHNGQVVEQGVSKEVFANPQNAYAKSLIETFFNKILVEK